MASLSLDLIRAARPLALGRACPSPQAHRTGAVVVCDRTLEQTLLTFRGKRGRALLVPSEQILWFQVQNGVHATTAKDSFWVNYQLAELEAALPPDEFFRARREVLVNVSQIKEFKPYFKSSFLLILSERQARPLRLRLPGL